MSNLPIGVSYQDLQVIVEAADRGNTIPEAFLAAGLPLYERQGEIISNKTAYWFMFDNLNRESAQELWVRAWAWKRFRLENELDPHMPHQRRRL